MSYPTTLTYPQIGAEARYVQCGHCHEMVNLRGDQLEFHNVAGEEVPRVCPGSNRLYYNLFGTMTEVERG